MSHFAFHVLPVRAQGFQCAAAAAERPSGELPVRASEASGVSSEGFQDLPILFELRQTQQE